MVWRPKSAKFYSGYNWCNGVYNCSYSNGILQFF